MQKMTVNSKRFPGLLAMLAMFCLTAPVVQAQTNPAFSGITASAEDATAAYNNPAGLTRIDHTQIVGVVSIGYGESDFQNLRCCWISGSCGDSKSLWIALRRRAGCRFSWEGRQSQLE